MSGIRRGPAWFLKHDQDGSIAALERRQDTVDIQIDGLHRIRYEETKARLERLGIDTTRYREPPHLLAWEQRCSNHLRDGDDVEQLIRAAQEKPLDKAFREFIAANPHLEPEIRVR